MPLNHHTVLPSKYYHSIVSNEKTETEWLDDLPELMLSATMSHLGNRTQVFPCKPSPITSVTVDVISDFYFNDFPNRKDCKGWKAEPRVRSQRQYRFWIYSKTCYPMTREIKMLTHFRNAGIFPQKTIAIFKVRAEERRSCKNESCLVNWLQKLVPRKRGLAKEGQRRRVKNAIRKDNKTLPT